MTRLSMEYIKTSVNNRIEWNIDCSYIVDNTYKNKWKNVPYTDYLLLPVVLKDRVQSIAPCIHMYMYVL